MASALSTCGPILVGPQLDGSPSWNLFSTLFIASHGTRARSSARRRRSRSRTSWHFASACRWKAEFASFSTWESNNKLRGCDRVSLKVRDICHGDLYSSAVRRLDTPQAVVRALKNARVPAHSLSRCRLSIKKLPADSTIQSNNVQIYVFSVDLHVGRLYNSRIFQDFSLNMCTEFFGGTADNFNTAF